MRLATRHALHLAPLVLAAALPLAADEGMWMPQQIPALGARLAEMGFSGDPSVFADLTGHPMGAVVSLGGCSASFVSPDGLLVTNHHCATGALQYNSTPERDLLCDGYLAATREQELWNGPGRKLWVTVSVKEATAEIADGLDPALDDFRRQEAIERRVKQRLAACEAGGLRCKVAAFFEGLQFFEIAQLEIQDVRTVYAPPEGIGNFGGETDNWRWPRHTGDWSFFRAYIDVDGKAAPYSSQNVPFRPRHWLKVAQAGPSAGDLVLVAGYPGRTQRHRTWEEVKETAEWGYPRTIRLNQEKIAILEKLGESDAGLRINAASRLRGLHNTLTNRRGVLEGLVNGGILARKQAAQKDLEDWIASDPARRGRYGELLPALAALRAQAEATREHDAVLTDIFDASSLLSAALKAILLSRERPKADPDRDLGLQERDWDQIREEQRRLQRNLDPRIDRALLRWAMGLAASLPAGQRIASLDQAVGLRPAMGAREAEVAIDAYLEPLYAGTGLADEGRRLSLLEKTTDAILATKDPFVELALALDPAYQAKKQAEKTREGAYSRLRPRYVEALLAKAGGAVAPDANGTLRVTFGRVQGADGKDGLFFKPFTTLAGVEQKHTGEGEFAAPPRQLRAIQALRGGKRTAYLDQALGDVPVDFLSTVDTTGGNSGSPTLNAKGELIGLLFDGTYDTIASNFVYEPVRTRSIHVDARYMLWVMSEVDGAGRLLQEMGVQ